MERNLEQSNDNKNLSFTAKVYPVKEPRENLLAFASLNIGNVFAVQGVKVMQGKNGPFVAMPQMKNKQGEWHDIAFPTTKEGRAEISRVVLEEYQKIKAAPERTPAQQAPAQNHAPVNRQQGAPQRNNNAR